MLLEQDTHLSLAGSHKSFLEELQDLSQQNLVVSFIGAEIGVRSKNLSSLTAWERRVN